MLNVSYTILRGEIVPASERDRFFPEGAKDLEVGLEHHGYSKIPEIQLGDDISVLVYAVESPKTDFAEKFHYIANYRFATIGEIVLIPRLGDLNAFLSQTVPICMAQLQQSARDDRADRHRQE
jgi:hypothetical protein